MRFKTIAKITVLVALVMFFTPFVMVSCDKQKVANDYMDGMSLTDEINYEDEYTGMELITRGSKESPYEGMEEYDNYDYNYWLAGAFGLGVITLILLFIRNKNFVAALTSLIAVILLIIFRLTFISFYKLESMKEYITIEYKWGYIVCIVCFILTSITAFLAHIREEDDFY